MALLLTVLAVFVILVASELWWRKQALHEEFSRKFIHITVGSFVAFWPYFLSQNEILLLSAAFIIGVLVSKKINLFGAIHSVQRPTNGELFFALMVGALTFVEAPAEIYTTALLVMAVADGMAAVVGTKYGTRTRYKIFGYTKSIIGSTTFFTVTVIILTGYFILADQEFQLLWVLPVSLAATLVENIGIRGFDNLAVPLLIAFSLQALQ